MVWKRLLSPAFISRNLFQFFRRFAFREVKFGVRQFSFEIPLPVFFCLGSALFFLVLFFLFVDLKPHVDENFFFSSEDPQFKADKMISEIFPQPPQFVIGAKGDPRSPQYVEKIRAFSDELEALPDVFAVQSLTHGPEDFDDAFESPLWRRVLLSEDGEATFLSVFIKDVPAETIVPVMEKIRDRFQGPEFQLILSGAPYIIELIRRNLARDLQIFSILAFLVFGLVLFFIFHSFTILLGTFVACIHSSTITLLLARALHIEIGPLTANLSTMVFVLTLSPIVFITFNWKRLKEEGEAGSALIEKAIRLTFGGSFWSMATTVLGFVSLLFAQATPLRQLGISGGIGTFVAFAAAYTIYPSFLQMKRYSKVKPPPVEFKPVDLVPFFKKRHNWITAALFLLTLACFSGLWKVNTDPDLLAYFEEGSELRVGLEYIDKNGGSSPLKVVVADQDQAPLSTGTAYKKLWLLHNALEKNPAVGNVVSLPLILAEAKRSPLTFFISTRWLLKLLESPRFGEIAQYFVTKDRKKSLFLLRMRESGRRISRIEVIQQVKQIIENHGFSPALVGGAYLLQGQLSQLLTSSLISGLGLLVVLFVFMGWLLSRSLGVSTAMLAGLAMIPIAMLGLLGHFHIPLDIISAPAANLAIGMGVDAMMYMVFFARRFPKGSIGSWEVWSKAASQLWKPIGCNLVVLSAGFGIFLFSNFPPTQRFGLSVVLGSFLSALASLFVLPWFATVGVKSGMPTKENGSVSFSCD